MSRYHSRRESLYDAERAEFVTRATALHKMMMEASRNLATSRADYRALTNLNGSICEAIKGSLARILSGCGRQSMIARLCRRGS